MLKKIHASALALVVGLTTLAFIGDNFGVTAAAAPATVPQTMLASLPASDFVMYVDTQRLLTDAVPNLLASNPTLAAKMNEGLDKLRDKEGVDVRALDGIAIGLRFGSAGPNDFHFVAVGRGRFEADKVVATIFKGMQGRGASAPQEQQYEGKTIYVEPAAAAAPRKKTSRGTRGRLRARARKGNHAQTNDQVGKAKTPAKSRMAFTTLDANSIAFGDLESVRAAIDANAGRVGRANEEMVSLATRNANAVLGFSGKVPPSFTKMFGPQANPDPSVKLLSSITEFYGSFGTVGNDAEALLTLRTENADQARDLGNLLDLVKGMSGDKSVALPGAGLIVSVPMLLKNLTITTESNEVQASFKITQAEIAPLLQGFQVPGAQP